MIAGSISHPALPADRRGNHARVLDDLRPALPAEKTALGCVHLPAFSAAGFPFGRPEQAVKARPCGN
jgi:hypothetical protein